MNSESLSLTIKIIKNLLPEFDDSLAKVKLGHGFFNFPPAILELLCKEGLPPWATFYEDPARLKSLAAHTMIGPDQVEEFHEFVGRLSLDEQAAFKEEIKLEAINSELFDSQVDESSTPTLEESTRQWEEMTEAEQLSAQKHLYLCLYSAITQMAFYLSLMSFGQSICDLVREAKAGSDQALFKAVQIDKTTLTGIPYFQKRLLRAQLGSEPQFLHNLALALEGPALIKKLSYPKLMFVFAVLKDEGFLDMPLNELMDVCEEIGVYGREFGIEDTESLRKRRKYYKEKTGRQIRI